MSGEQAWSLMMMETPDEILNPFRQLYKLYELKQALDEMELAKINAERDLIGLDPIRPWFVRRSRSASLRSRFRTIHCISDSRFP